MRDVPEMRKRGDSTSYGGIISYTDRRLAVHKIKLNYHKKFRNYIRLEIRNMEICVAVLVIDKF